MNDLAPFLDRFLTAVPGEACGARAAVEGDLPDFLRGTLYINGPGRFTRGGLHVRHWLDGDGLVCAVRFDHDGVRHTARFVRTDKLEAEERAGRPLFRAFGTAFPGDRLQRGVALASPINVSVYPFAETLLALGEQGVPWALDPITLETRGPFTFDGALNDVSPFSAHPKRDLTTGQLINFGISYSAVRPMLNLYCFSPAAALEWRRRVPLDHPRSIHDFGVTDRHLVFYMSPYLLDIGAIAAGGTVMDALAWRPELGSRLMVVARDSGELLASIAIGSCYCLHFVNCYERGAELIVDVIEYERPIYDQYRLPALFAGVGEGHAVRFAVDVAAGRVVDRRASGYRSAPDFPCHDPRAAGRPCDEFWAIGISAAGRDGRKFFDQLVHVDWRRPDRPRVYQPRAGRFFTGEPAVVPPPGGGAFALICPMYDAALNRTELAVFDASDIQRGPAASLALSGPLPPLFHSTFAPNRS